METLAPRRRNADQDQELAADLTRFERVVTNARDDADAQALLAPAEYDAAALDLLLAQVESAQTAYTARAKAMPAEDAAYEAKEATEASARSALGTFRKVARARFRRDPDALTALRLNDQPPDALDPFITDARTAYEAAASEPYLSRLGRGYTAERLAALIAELGTLVDTANAFGQAEARATATTATRNAEATAARHQFAEFRDTARAILPKDLVDRIGLG